MRLWLLGLVAALALGVPSAQALVDCSCYDLYRIGADGTGRHLLSRGGSRDLGDVSRDLSRIAFQHRVGVLEVSTLTGTGRHIVAGAFGAQIGEVRFSPDGRTVAYALGGGACAGASSIHVVEVDGSDDRTVVAGCAASSGLAWSPDGRKLAYVRVPSDLVVHDLGTGMERVLAHRPGAIGNVRWSPAGDRLAYSEFTRRATTLHVVRADGSRDLAISRGSAPTWSPDGRLLEYLWLRPAGKPPRVAIIARDGTHNHVLDPRAIDGYGQGVGWSPDGRRIVYRVAVKVGRDERMALWTARPDGSRRRHLLTGRPHEEFGPLYWTRNGKAILYTSYVQLGE